MWILARVEERSNDEWSERLRLFCVENFLKKIKDSKREEFWKNKINCEIATTIKRQVLKERKKYIFKQKTSQLFHFYEWTNEDFQQHQTAKTKQKKKNQNPRLSKKNNIYILNNTRCMNKPNGWWRRENSETQKKNNFSIIVLFHQRFFRKSWGDDDERSTTRRKNWIISVSEFLWNLMDNWMMCGVLLVVGGVRDHLFFLRCFSLAFERVEGVI